MTGLSKITDRILNDARADAQRLLDEADAQCARIAEKTKLDAADRRSEMDAIARREAEEILNRAHSAEATVSRDTVLDIKGRSVDKAFGLAKTRLLSLPENEYLALLTDMMNAALKANAEDERARIENGDNAEVQTSECTLMLNTVDREKYGKALVAAATDKVALSDKTATIDGGLILSFGAMEINCSIDKILEQLRPTLEARVYRALFPEYAQKR